MNYFYVICPVRSDPDFAVKRNVLLEISNQHALEPLFPLERREGFRIQTLMNEMKNAAFVLADLSLQRPSCYFELGLAEACDARILLIALSATPIHQVGDREMVLFYRDLKEYEALVRRYIDKLFL